MTAPDPDQLAYVAESLGRGRTLGRAVSFEPARNRSEVAEWARRHPWVATLLAAGRLVAVHARLSRDVEQLEAEGVGPGLRRVLERLALLVARYRDTIAWQDGPDVERFFIAEAPALAWIEGVRCFLEGMAKGRPVKPDEADRGGQLLSAASYLNLLEAQPERFAEIAGALDQLGLEDPDSQRGLIAMCFVGDMREIVSRGRPKS